MRWSYVILGIHILVRWHHHIEMAADTRLKDDEVSYFSWEILSQDTFIKLMVPQNKMIILTLIARRSLYMKGMFYDDGYCESDELAIVRWYLLVTPMYSISLVITVSNFIELPWQWDNFGTLKAWMILKKKVHILCWMFSIDIFQ